MTAAPPARKIAVVTVARSDYGIYRPLLRRLETAPDLTLQLIVAGMHLAPEFGDTRAEILADGFQPAAEVECCLAGDRPGTLARAMGLGTIGYAQALETLRPDILIVLGDRFEMHAAAVAAQPFLIPVVHIAGGALTGGAIDDSLRHSMTKLASLHFPEIEVYAARIQQMGEPPNRIHVTGSLNLDNLAALEPLSLDELNRRFGLALTPDAPPLLVTFHPVTRAYRDTETHVTALLQALDKAGRPIVFTAPNADTEGRRVMAMIEAFVEARPRAYRVAHFGSQAYFSMMAQAAAMVGNSSSGIIEAASFRLPVVNIGSRQDGRFAPENVIHVGDTAADIAAGIARATDPDFRDGLQQLSNPYGDGRAAERMVEVLRGLELNRSLIEKPFHEAAPV